MATLSSGFMLQRKLVGESILSVCSGTKSKLLMHRIRLYSTEITGFEKILDAHVARGEAKCYMTFSNFPSPNVTVPRVLHVI